jgi:competence ComEA-like helix-hairpin-helix protein
LYLTKKKIQPSEGALDVIRETTFSLQPFNPNKASLAELTEIGFNDKQANNVIAYREKVGPFEVKSDFKKLYTITDSMYDVLKPYLNLPDSIKDFENNRDSIADNRNIADNPKKVNAPVSSIDINTCDSLQLLELWGIGPYYAQIIIAYREKLGGFVSVEQLQEVKGIRPESLKQLQSYFYVHESFEPRKIDINSDNFKEFLEHPYFDYYHTKKLFDYRNQHGKFTSLHALKKVGYIEKDYVDKVSPYLKVNSSDTRKN